MNTLTTRDFVKGLILAVLVPVLTTIATSLEAGEFIVHWKPVLIIAASSFVGYLLKNLVQPTQLNSNAPNLNNRV